MTGSAWVAQFECRQSSRHTDAHPRVGAAARALQDRRDANAHWRHCTPCLREAVRLTDTGRTVTTGRGDAVLAVLQRTLLPRPASQDPWSDYAGTERRMRTRGCSALVSPAHGSGAFALPPERRCFSLPEPLSSGIFQGTWSLSSSVGAGIADTGRCLSRGRQCCFLEKDRCRPLPESAATAPGKPAAIPSVRFSPRPSHIATT